MNESEKYSHGKYTLKLYTYSVNSLYFDGMCVICIVVGHGQSCSLSIQCANMGPAECVSNTCQCRSGFNFNGERCTGNIGMYKAYINNIIYNAIFSAKIIILASLMEIKQWLQNISLNTQQNQRSVQQQVVRIWNSIEFLIQRVA